MFVQANSMNHKARWDPADVGQQIWLSDDADGYVEGEIVSVADTMIGVQTKHGKRLQLDTQAPLNPPKRGRKEEIRRILPRSHGGPVHGVEDMDSLLNLNEAEVLDNVQLRFRLDKIYTRTGPILIAMNPFKFLPIYGPDITRQYHSRPYGSLPPHCYQEAEDAFQVMYSSKKPQAVVICGESGAGKTETTKLMLQYLSSIAKPHRPGEEDVMSLGDQIVQSNPLLESFGNAKTTRNNNSSRFGKFTVVNFDAAGIISGGHVAEFLLEKSRVVLQSLNERNYHIFYQLLEGASSEDRSVMELGRIIDYRMLNNSGCIKVDRMDDAEDFEATKGSMQAIGMVELEQNECFRVVSAVLQIGNVNFTPSADDEACRITDPTPALSAARLLGIDAGDLNDVLITMVREVSGTKVTSPMTVAQSESSRDAMQKMIYSRLFNWIIRRVNAAYEKRATSSVSSIGILDIFGFENMDINAFEQVFINFTNETLQHIFNKAVFMHEKEEYEREQIEWSGVQFPDNTPCIELLSKRPLGVLPFMDSECSRGAAATDASFVGKLHKAHKDHPNYAVCGPDTVWKKKGGAFTERDEFLIKHYAGNVIYSTNDIIDKNRDTLFDHVHDLIASSSSPLLTALFPQRDVSGGRGVAQQVQRTVSARFLTDLSNLIETLGEMDVRFVRCIKTNDKLQPQLLEKNRVLHQLVYSGVISALEVRRAGFPTRLIYEEFVKKFRVLDTGTRDANTLRAFRAQDQIAEAMSKKGSPREVCARMMTHDLVLQRIQSGQYRLGLTKLFLHADVIQVLERVRDSQIEPFVRRLQRWWISTRANWLQHSLQRMLSRIAETIDYARFNRVHHDTVVRGALEDIVSAGRTIKGRFDSYDVETAGRELRNLMDKTDHVRDVVAEAIATKLRLAREKGELLSLLDSGSVRIASVESNFESLKAHARVGELQSLASQSNSRINGCRQKLLRGGSRTDMEETKQLQNDSRTASRILQRSLTKAVMMAKEEDDDFDREDDESALDSQRSQVRDAVAIVDQAEDLCQQLMEDLFRLDQARSAYSKNLSATEQELRAVQAQAEASGIIGNIRVQHIISDSRLAIETAIATLKSDDLDSFDSVVSRADELVREAGVVVEEEAYLRQQELTRSRANMMLQAIQKKFRQISADADLFGLESSPSFARASSTAADALNQATMLERGDPNQYESAVSDANRIVDNLSIVCDQEKARKDRLEMERKEELRKLQSSIDTLASLRAKIEFSSSDSGSTKASREALDQAQVSLNEAVAIVQTADDMGPVHSIVTDAIMKVASAERIVIDERQRKDAIDREVTKALKAFSTQQRKLEEINHSAEGSGIVVSEMIAGVVSDGESVLSDAFRAVRNVESVAAIKKISNEVTQRVEAAEVALSNARRCHQDAERQRLADTSHCSELRRALADCQDLSKDGLVSDIPAVRSALQNAENSLTVAESRLEKSLSLAWMEHDGSGADASALRDAEIKVAETEKIVVAEKRRYDSDLREFRSNQSSFEFVMDRLASLQALATSSGVESNTEVSSGLSNCKIAVEAARSSILERPSSVGGIGGGAHAKSASMGRASIDVVVASLDSAEATINRVRLSKEGSDKERMQTQAVLDMCLTKYQAINAVVEASGAQVATMVQEEMDAATDAINTATKLLRRGEDISTFNAAVEAAVRTIDLADEAITHCRNECHQAKRTRQVISNKLNSLVETYEVMAEKASTMGVRHLPSVSTAINSADSILQLCRTRSGGSIEEYLRDSQTIERLIDEAVTRVQNAEEMVDSECSKKERTDKEKSAVRIDFERWLTRHSHCVQQAEQWGINDVSIVQSSLAAAEKEIEAAEPGLRSGHISRLNVLAAKIQHEEEVIGLEKQKKERKLLEIQRIKKELPSIQRRVSSMHTEAETCGPLVGALVESELSDADRAFRNLEAFLEYGENFSMLQPALDDVLNRLSHAEESIHRHSQRVRKAKAEKQTELNKLTAVESRFRDVGREVARFCARSDHLRMQLTADWSDTSWWGSQVRHTRTGGEPSGRGEIRPVPAVTAITESMASCESAISDARKKVGVSVEDWMSLGPTAAHTAVEEAISRVEEAARVVDTEADKLSADEKDRKAIAAALETQIEKLSGTTAMAKLMGVIEIPRVADAIREAEQALQAAGHVVSSGNVGAAGPALKVTEKAVNEAGETVVIESQRRDRSEAELNESREHVTDCRRKIVEISEMVKLLELEDSALVSEMVSYAEKAVQSAELVLQGDFAPAIVSREAFAAGRAVEEADRVAKLERGRREQLAILKSQREAYARQLQQRKAQELYCRHDEEMRQRRLLQDQLEDAVHRLAVQAPALEGARGSVVAAESAIDAARQKLVRGGIGAASEAVRGALNRVDDAVEMNLLSADLAGGGSIDSDDDSDESEDEGKMETKDSHKQQRGRARREDLFPDEGPIVPLNSLISKKSNGDKASGTGQTANKAVRKNDGPSDEFMKKTSNALESMTSNIQFLSQGLLNIGQAIQRQGQVLNVQSNLIRGVGDRGSLLTNLSSLTGGDEKSASGHSIERQGGDSGEQETGGEEFESKQTVENESSA